MLFTSATGPTLSSEDMKIVQYVLNFVANPTEVCFVPARQW